MIIALEKFLEKNENTVPVFLTILVLILIGIYGNAFYIIAFMFIFLGVKLCVLLFQLFLSLMITDDLRQKYDSHEYEKNKKKGKKRAYEETRIGLNISENKWNSFSMEEKNRLCYFYSTQKRAIWYKFINENPRHNIAYDSTRYYNIISEANKSLEWKDISEETRISLINKYEQIQYEKEKKKKENEKIKNDFIKQRNLLENVENKEVDSTFTFFKYASIVLIFFMLFTCGTRKKIGATCSDGTTSNSIGSGTCSHHDGVSSWKYSYWWD